MLMGDSGLQDGSRRGCEPSRESEHDLSSDEAFGVLLGYHDGKTEEGSEDMSGSLPL